MPGKDGETLQALARQSVPSVAREVDLAEWAAATVREGRKWRQAEAKAHSDAGMGIEEFFFFFF